MSSPRIEKTPILFKGNFIAGAFQAVSKASGEWTHQSPADYSDDFGKIAYSYEAIHEAVSAANTGLPAWKKMKVSERAEYLKKYQNVLKEKGDLICEVISREVGKPLWESRTELNAMIGKVDITINEGLQAVQDYEIPKIADETLGACRYKPLGILAVIGPFNFPGHLPNGHIVPALLTGNAVIFKPSEKTPLTGQLIAECMEEAGIPRGIFNLVQGEKEVGRRLCVHEAVAGVLFTGSYEVGNRIKQDTLQQYWKLLALEMGGKNSAIVCEDANLDLAVYESLTGAYLTTGQRCSATSRILVQKSRLDEFLDKFHKKAKAFAIGHPFENPFMGCLIDRGSVDRYTKFIGIASREGCEVVMGGKPLELSYRGNYVTPSICYLEKASLENTKKSIYQQSELFAPNVLVMGVDDLNEAVAQANATQYGLVTSVFTQSKDQFRTAWETLDAGLINWNKSTVGASSRLPFGGLKKSGNHFPTAITAAHYCTVPVASLELENSGPVDEMAGKVQGLNWNS